MAVDVGHDCVDLATYGRIDGYTLVNDNAASTGGTADEIDAQCLPGYGTTAAEFAAFEESSNNMTTDGMDNGEDSILVAGECTTLVAGVGFTAFLFDAGEYIGVHGNGAGRLEAVSDGGSTYWSATGDYIPCTGQAFSSGNYYLALGVRFAAAGGLSIPAAMHLYKQLRRN